MKTIIATLLLTTLFASAQGLTRDIVIGSTTLNVREGLIVAFSQAEPTRSEPLRPPANSIAEKQVRRPTPQPAPKASAATQPAAVLGPVYDIVLPSGVRITVTVTNTFDHAQLRRWLREASQQLPNR